MRLLDLLTQESKARLAGAGYTPGYPVLPPEIPHAEMRASERQFNRLVGCRRCGGIGEVSSTVRAGRRGRARVWRPCPDCGGDRGD